MNNNIHSKNFSVSDWLKSHTWFVITSYCRPNLEEFCDLWKMTSIVQQNCQIIEPPTEKTWGRGWDVLVVSTKRRNIWLVSQRRNERTIGLKYTKNSKKTTWRTPSAIWRIFGLLSNPLSPKLADKQATEDELKIDGGKHVLACF